MGEKKPLSLFKINELKQYESISYHLLTDGCITGDVVKQQMPNTLLNVFLDAEMA